MPAPKPKEKSPVRQPEEVGLSGGSPTEVNPPHEIELTTVNSYGEREVRTIQGLTFNYVLKEVADEIFNGVVEEIKHDLLAELPYPRFKASIFGVRDGDVFIVEVRGKQFTKVLYIKKTKAVYYFGGMMVEGFNIYIPAEAVYSRREKVTYYEIIKSKEAVEAIAKDLEALMEGEEL
jgi:hypothetical protein